MRELKFRICDIKALCQSTAFQRNICSPFDIQKQLQVSDSTFNEFSLQHINYNDSVENHKLSIVYDCWENFWSFYLILHPRFFSLFSHFRIYGDGKL